MIDDNKKNVNVIIMKNYQIPTLEATFKRMSYFLSPRASATED